MEICCSEGEEEMKSNLERIITFKLAAASWFLSGGDFIIYARVVNQCFTESCACVLF